MEHLQNMLSWRNEYEIWPRRKFRFSSWMESKKKRKFQIEDSMSKVIENRLLGLFSWPNIFVTLVEKTGPFSCLDWLIFLHWVLNRFILFSRCEWTSCLIWCYTTEVFIGLPQKKLLYKGRDGFPSQWKRKSQSKPLPELHKLIWKLLQSFDCWENLPIYKLVVKWIKAAQSGIGWNW